MKNHIKIFAIVAISTLIIYALLKRYGLLPHMSKEKTASGNPFDMKTQFGGDSPFAGVDSGNGYGGNESVYMPLFGFVGYSSYATK